jgi:hypothetical protein
MYFAFVCEGRTMKSVKIVLKLGKREKNGGGEY